MNTIDLTEDCEVGYSTNRQIEDMEAKNMKIERCHICYLGFLEIGNLASKIGLENHLNVLHNNKCRECGMNFISEIHLR